ncbi:MAG TPA: biotin transporter BioY [Candidatus Nitrosotalea sp.]|nr:biotin transporter BioY [Candidatus Nitrosotalea sp.]
MSQQAAYRPGSVLADSWAGSRLGDLALVGLYAVFIGITAQVSIPLPFTPVPITGQTFGVLAGALALGSRRSLAGVLLYLALGLIGLPWFAQGQGGLGVIHLPTIGYLIGFIPAALIAGRLAEAGFYRTPWGAFGAMVLCSAVVYVLGVGGLMLTLKIPLIRAVELGVLPFLFGDAIKALLAALALPGADRLHRARG